MGFSELWMFSSILFVKNIHRNTPMTNALIADAASGLSGDVALYANLAAVTVVILLHVWETKFRGPQREAELVKAQIAVAAQMEKISDKFDERLGQQAEQQRVSIAESAKEIHNLALILREFTTMANIASTRQKTARNDES
jgi:uncharacterized protein YecA (UPF0149 family)